MFLTNIKSYFEIKYPLVFMHGIFFGSNDEIEFAHEEGFLYELFRDTGFYKLIDNMQPKPNLNSNSFAMNAENEKTNINLEFLEAMNDMEESYLDYSNLEDTNYSFAIDKIANINTKSNDVISFQSQELTIFKINIFNEFLSQTKSRAFQILKL